MIKEVIRIIYDDGTEEITRSGDVFYWPTGHTAIVEEELQFLEFSPEKEFHKVMDHIARMMDESGEG